MSFPVFSGACLMFLTTLLTFPENGSPQCYTPRGRSPGHVAVSCCPTVSEARVSTPVTFCFEQQKHVFPDCEKHAYIFIGINKTKYCVDPGASWLQTRLRKLQRRGICCQIL